MFKANLESRQYRGIFSRWNASTRLTNTLEVFRRSVADNKGIKLLDVITSVFNL